MFFPLVATETKRLQITDVVLSAKSKGDNMINSKTRL